MGAINTWTVGSTATSFSTAEALLEKLQAAPWIMTWEEDYGSVTRYDFVSLDSGNPVILDIVKKTPIEIRLHSHYEGTVELLLHDLGFTDMPEVSHAVIGFIDRREE